MKIAWVFFFFEGLLCFPFKTLSSMSENGVAILSAFVILTHAAITIASIQSFRGLERRVKSSIIVGFIFRLFLLIWSVFGRKIWTFPDMLDALTFETTAHDYYNYGMSNGRGGIYSKFVASILYGLFGEQPLVAQYFNVFLSVNTIILTIKTLDKIEISKESKFKAARIICLLPYLAIDDSIMLREAIIQFGIASSLYMFIIWMESRKHRDLVMAFALTIVASLFHSGAIAVAAGYSLWLVLYDRTDNRVRITSRSFSMSVLLVIGFLVLNRFLGNAVFAKFQAADSVTDVASVASSRTAGGAAYNIGLSSSSIGAVIVYTPIRMLYFLASPVPWLWRDITDIISFFLSAYFYIYTVWRGIRVLRAGEYRNREYVILCFFILIMAAAIFAWGVSNAGAAMRHRDKFIAPAIFLFAICNDILPKKRRKNI